jgi:asparagine synthase (glutamine-hydrolysing)
MCGIAGVWGGTDKVSVEDMIGKQAHRGPNGRGVHVQDNRGVLGHVRLSIIDPVRGKQPMYNEGRSTIIIANGQVYNHAKLRQRLIGPHQFASTSDSETILHLFEEQGFGTTGQLDGMFAFAVIEDDELFLARDPIGIKPLYYGIQNEGSAEQTLYFASELKAISRWVDDVREFPAGTYYHSRNGFRTYYTVPDNIPRAMPVEVHAQNVRHSLEKAVAKRLMSDVPLGAFLSGGLDSSVIAAIARQHKDELHTFAVGVEGSRDVEAARRVAKHIGSVHHEYAYSIDEVLEKLPEIVYYLESFDQDLVRSAIPTYFCARMAADYVKVILTGEGADELFAGYTYYKDIHDPDTLHKELRRSVNSLHNVNLQRVDRMTMRHSIEGRVPFLDTQMVEMAQTIPADLKLRANGNGKRVEKWILRKAVEDLLPHDIVWRNKEQFDEGSGTVDMLQEIIKTAAAEIDPVEYAARYPQDRLRSAEECYYHKLLVEAYEKPEVVLRNVGRWHNREEEG